jgi:competence protein ComEA
MVTLQEILKKLTAVDRILVVGLIIGLIVSFVSLFRGIMLDRQVQVEYINSDVSQENSRIIVDIQGAVITPGVYELKMGSRIKDLLAKAGGLSEKADRVYCEKNINLAEVLKDGQKYYIPYLTNTPTDPGYDEAKMTIKQVNINTATLAELDTLWGVGPARAETIVKNRPYGTLDDLVKKGSISKQILEKNKDLLTVY